VAAYLGLVPRELSSGESQRRGRITKAGPTRVRWLLVQVAVSMLRLRDPRTVAWREWAMGIAARRGKKVAVVALARRLAGILYPNTLHPVLARTPADVGLVLITLAALSDIGFGPGPYVPEWGSVVAAGQIYIFQALWLVILPGAAIFLTTLSLNLVGDWARDRLDPRPRS
jgi:hypothetical protein